MQILIKVMDKIKKGNLSNIQSVRQRMERCTGKGKRMFHILQSGDCMDSNRINVAAGAGRRC